MGGGEGGKRFKLYFMLCAKQAIWKSPVSKPVIRNLQIEAYFIIDEYLCLIGYECKYYSFKEI